MSQAVTKPTVQTVGYLIKAHITEHEALPRENINDHNG